MEHIYQEINLCVDTLVKVRIESKEMMIFLEDAPEFLVPIIRKDALETRVTRLGV